MLTFLAFLACGEPEDEDTAPDGGAATEDGGTDTGLEDTAAPCSYLSPGSRLVLQTACADGLCGGATWAQAYKLLGEPSSCMPSSSSRVQCDWGDMSVSFPDCDHDGLPDDDASCETLEQSIWLHGRWDGSSAEGLGLGILGECWVEALGPQAGNHTWTFGKDTSVRVTIEPLVGPVEAIMMAWSRKK